MEIAQGKYKILDSEEGGLYIQDLKYSDIVYSIDENHPKYHIVERGFEENKLLTVGQRWRLFQDKENIYGLGNKSSAKFVGDIFKIEPVENFIPSILKLKDFNLDLTKIKNIKTGSPLDSFFSNRGGIPSGSEIVLNGKPGAGKTTIFVESLCDIIENNPDMKVLFVSMEMGKFNLATKYTNRFPRWNNLSILFPEDNEDVEFINVLDKALEPGWDLVLVDSFNELVDYVKITSSINENKAMGAIRSIFKKNKYGNNESGIYTTFLNILQINKNNKYKGSTRIIHLADAHLELGETFDTEGNLQRYMTFLKNRDGEVETKLFYHFNENGHPEFINGSEEEPQICDESVEDSEGFEEDQEFSGPDDEKAYAPDEEIEKEIEDFELDGDMEFFNEF